MPYLIAVVVLVGALCLMNLVLALGLVRRLREHTKLLDVLYETIDLMGGPPGPRGELATGEVVGDFDATTLDGARVTRDLLVEGTVVAFLSADCGGCRDQLPEIASWAAGQDRDRIVAVVDARSGDPAELLTTLSPVAQVITEDKATQLLSAFKVQAFPTFCRLAEGGRLLAVEGRISRLSAGAAA